MTLRRLSSIVAAVCLAAAILGSCSRKAATVTWPAVPTTLELRQASSTTIGPDFSDTPLATALSQEQPSSTIAFGVGRVTMTGVVKGPDGPVEGAVVRIERLVDKSIASIDVTTDAKGRYRLNRVQGGRVRIRAYRSPDLAALEPIVTFASGEFNQDVNLKRYDQTSIQWSLAPSEPRLNEPANIVVQVSRQDVGADGVLRQVPVPSVGVTVTPLGLLQTDLIQETLTNERGRVQFAMRCLGVGGSDLQVALATGESAQISPPSCREATTTTQTTIAPTTLATIPVPAESTIPTVVVTPDPATTVPVVGAPTIAPVPVGAPAPLP